MYKCYLLDDHDSVMDVWPFECENDREAEESAIDLQAACSATAAEVWRGGRLVFRTSISLAATPSKTSAKTPTA
jgi:hypothetical protein